jgi:hypothetical protein
MRTPKFNAVGPSWGMKSVLKVFKVLEKVELS